MKAIFKLWVVEMWYAGQWHATVGVGIDRTQGRKELCDWKQRNPDDRFRLVRYARVESAALAAKETK